MKKLNFSFNDDPRWKKVTEFCKKCDFESAIKLVHQIEKDHNRN